jgi:hypothetical protein
MGIAFELALASLRATPDCNDPFSNRPFRVKRFQTVPSLDVLEFDVTRSPAF